jgi:diaminopimelate epimerase
MELRNSDGTRAETSGNGLRCFALAAVEAGLVTGTELSVETDAGVSRARVKRRDGAGSANVAVEMGRVRVMQTDPVSDALCPGSTERPWPAWFVDVGNPHLVVLAPSTAGVPIGVIGPLFERLRPDGLNVEIASVGPEHDEMSLVVWERGAGVTLACGTGSVAVAAALHSAGFSPARVRVHNPGGTAEVVLSDQDPLAPLAELSGPVHRVARIEVDEAALGAAEVVVVAS